MAGTSREAAEPSRDGSRSAFRRGRVERPSDRGAAGGEIDERIFVERLRSGEDHAFTILVRLHGDRLLATARRILGHDEDARDAVQKAFLSAFQAMAAFNGDSRISTWLHRIVVNSALMKLRTRRRKPEEAIDALVSELSNRPPLLRPTQRWECPTDELVERAQTRARVRLAIDRLPERYREVLRLRDIDGFDTEETARLVGCTVGAVKLRVHRARRALRAVLENELEPESRR